MQEKHAYLIIAHKVDYTLMKLLELIDDERNDIFVHMDKKNKTFVSSDLTCAVQHSRIFYPDSRISVTWGGLSLLKCELGLFELATGKGRYSYYHLISGEDLPIKSQDYIHCFFDKNKGKEFIGFDSEEFSWAGRIQRYHFFSDIIGRKRGAVYDILRKIDTLSLKCQNLLNTKRYPDMQFQKGCNWVSVTDEFARALVSQKRNLEKMYRFTFVSDEVYKQTFVINNGFRQSLYIQRFGDNQEAMMRKIDWERGNPYVWRKGDVEELMNSELLFARKFDSKIDKTIIDEIVSIVCKSNSARSV